MSRAAKGPFDIADVPSWVPRRVKPWIFILFVLIIQFAGGIYLAAATDMVGTTALMQEDILMAGYAQIVGMSLNFALMFRIKFRFSNRTQLLAGCIVLLAANMITYRTDSVALLVGTCFIAGWFRMQATFACNSTIQLWITPVRNMAIFFCYVYLLVDGAIQLSGLATVYTAFAGHWEDMQYIIGALLVLMIVLVYIFVKPVRTPLQIPLLGIDWLGSVLWGGFMLCFVFVCVYGDFYDWWDSVEITGATLLGVTFAGINLWRATFLRHPYITLMAMTNRNVVRVCLVYTVYFIIMGTEHVFESSYAIGILGFDQTNVADLNWAVLAGIIVGVVFTYVAFGLLRWRYKSMITIGFMLVALYLAYFYFTLDYNVEKQALVLPLFIRGVASVVISIVCLTAIVQSGLPFLVFPQALVLNGFFVAVAGATLGPAVIGEWLSHTLARNYANLSMPLTAFDTPAMALPELTGMVRLQAMAMAMKEIYGWLLIVCLLAIIAILVSYGRLRPNAIFPKWRTVRRALRHLVRSGEQED